MKQKDSEREQRRARRFRRAQPIDMALVYQNDYQPLTRTPITLTGCTSPAAGSGCSWAPACTTSRPAGSVCPPCAGPAQKHHREAPHDQRRPTPGLSGNVSKAGWRWAALRSGRGPYWTTTHLLLVRKIGAPAAGGAANAFSARNGPPDREIGD
jgi:hypothetical protein